MVESLIVRKGFISFIFLTKNPHRNRWGFFIFQLLVSPGYPSPSPGRPQSRFCLEKGYMTLLLGRGKSRQNLSPRHQVSWCEIFFMIMVVGNDFLIIFVVLNQL